MLNAAARVRLIRALDALAVRHPEYVMKKLSIVRAIRISRSAAFPLAFLASAFALSAVGFVPSTAQSPEREEREIEDASPKQMPIKFKVKNEEKIKDLKNERWEHDLEIEVTNTGARPIYFISFSLGIPEARAPNGQVIGFTFHYGRINMIDYTVKAEPDDVPLLPGAPHVFRIREDNLKGWESVKAKYPNPKKLRLRTYYVNFGDGTGLLGDGTPVGSKK